MTAGESSRISTTGTVTLRTIQVRGGYAYARAARILLDHLCGSNYLTHHMIAHHDWTRWTIAGVPAALLTTAATFPVHDEAFATIA